MSVAQEALRSKTERQNPYLAAIAVFLFFVVMFLLLRTRQYLAVDGAIRSLEVYHRQALFFHGNNHLLYPTNIFLWSQALRLLGFHAHTPFEFIASSQALNGIAAAGCLAVMYVLVWIASESTAVSLTATVAYGFSRAFMLHATNAAEPVVGLFFSALGMLIVVESLRRGKAWLLPLAGVCLGLALACYESMALIAPLALLLCMGWPASNAKPSWSTRWIRIALVSSGGLVAVCAIYGWAYWTFGDRTIATMIHRFFQVPEQQVYGYLSPAKVVNLPIGLTTALLPTLPPNYQGIRWLLRESNNLPRIIWILAVALGLCLVSWQMGKPIIERWRSIDPFQRFLILALIIALLVLIAPLVYWAPLYDKLWLQPLGAMIVLLAVLHRIGANQVRQKAAALLVFCLVALEVLLNLCWAIPAHRNPTKGITESMAVADVVKPHDLIVLNFDQISILYLMFWGSGRNALLLPASTPDSASSRLARAIQETREVGGRVYFLSLLDMSEQAWTAFLGDRVGIPYHSFDTYRSRSTVVQSYQLDGSLTTLRVLH